MKLTPTKIKKIFADENGPTRFETWTQIKKLNSWPPAENFALMSYGEYILVGASALNKAALDVWRREHSVYSLHRTTYMNQSDREYVPTISNKNDEAWLEMYNLGMRQGEIAKALGVSNAYVSIIKRKMRQLGRISA